MRQAYQVTGTAHIIAISGFNITILAGRLMAVFSRLLGRRRGGCRDRDLLHTCSCLAWLPATGAACRIWRRRKVKPGKVYHNTEFTEKWRASGFNQCQPVDTIGW